MSLSSQDVVDLCKQHTIFSWSAGGNQQPLVIDRAEGIYCYTRDGKRIIDFNSQLMSVLVGHSHPKVIARMKKALDEVLFVQPAWVTEVRGRVGKLLAELVPGHINSFFFTLGGAEANENAMRTVRLVSGRQKILSRYRSYHGATSGVMQLTGDPRRWANEPGTPGVVRVLDPEPYEYSFGKSEEEKTANNLRYLEEVIQYEGPQTIAAMFIETVTGTNGILPPPKGYLQGLRKLLDKYGIMLVCDEVMCGFGRTGKWFAFEHGDIVPDIVTMAKGLTSSYIPLGAMGVSDRIAEHFKTNVYYGGLTYNAHSFALATAEAVLTVMKEEGMIENAQKMGAVMRQEMERLQKKHVSIRETRNIGLFGAIDIRKNSKNEHISAYNTTAPAVQKMNKWLIDNGLFTMTHWSTLMCNPPLVINEAQLREAFQLVDKALDITDEAYEG